MMLGLTAQPAVLVAQRQERDGARTGLVNCLGLKSAAVQSQLLPLTATLHHVQVNDDCLLHNNDNHCNILCLVWSAWELWSQCSPTCSSTTGQRSRTRNCQNIEHYPTADCPGEDTRNEDCSIPACPGKEATNASQC